MTGYPAGLDQVVALAPLGDAPGSPPDDRVGDHPRLLRVLSARRSGAEGSHHAWCTAGEWVAADHAPLVVGVRPLVSVGLMHSHAWLRVVVVANQVPERAASLGRGQAVHPTFVAFSRGSSSAS